MESVSMLYALAIALTLIWFRTFWYRSALFARFCFGFLSGCFSFFTSLRIVPIFACLNFPCAWIICRIKECQNIHLFVISFPFLTSLLIWDFLSIFVFLDFLGIFFVFSIFSIIYCRFFCGFLFLYRMSLCSLHADEACIPRLSHWQKCCFHGAKCHLHVNIIC